MNSELSLIKTEEQYRAYLVELEELMSAGPNADTPKSKRLELLGLLLETYEKQNFPISKPTPVEAISFRLEQMGLRASDLIPMIGSKGRISEIMSEKRKLTLPMVRNLSRELGIPLDVLIGDERANEEQKRTFTPLEKELVRRGWVAKEDTSSKTAEEFLSSLWSRLGVKEVEQVYFRKSLNIGTSSEVDLAAIHAWVARIIFRSRDLKSRGKFDRKVLTDDLLRELPRFSWFENGPLLAKLYLEKLGIAVVIEPHLPGTGIDGASTLDVDGVPVIGLTLRHDRLDNFWFTLLHECVHIVRHLRDPGDVFVDDVEGPADDDAKETEANRLARDFLIPPAAWRSSIAPKVKTAEAVRALADQLRISPAIVAGRIRRESGNYKILTSLVGYKCVSKFLRPT